MSDSQRLPQAGTTWSDAAAPAFLSNARPQEGRLASFSIPAPGIRVAAFLRQALGQPRVFWANGR